MYICIYVAVARIYKEADSVSCGSEKEERISFFFSPILPPFVTGMAIEGTGEYIH